MHLQAKQSISPNNSPNVTQVLQAGKSMIMVKGHGKKAWRWRGLHGILSPVRHLVSPGSWVGPGARCGCPRMCLAA